MKNEGVIDVNSGSIIVSEFIFLNGNMKNGNKQKQI